MPTRSSTRRPAEHVEQLSPLRRWRSRLARCRGRRSLSRGPGAESIASRKTSDRSRRDRSRRNAPPSVEATGRWRVEKLPSFIPTSRDGERNAAHGHHAQTSRARESCHPIRLASSRRRAHRPSDRTGVSHRRLVRLGEACERRRRHAPGFPLRRRIGAKKRSTTPASVAAPRMAPRRQNSPRGRRPLPERPNSRPRGPACPHVVPNGRMPRRVCDRRRAAVSEGSRSSRRPRVLGHGASGRAGKPADDTHRMPERRTRPVRG